MTKEILGYRKFKSEKGQFCIVNVVAPYQENDIRHGAIGGKTEEVWIPEDFQHMITPDVIGKGIECAYEVTRSNGRVYANIIDVQII